MARAEPRSGPEMDGLADTGLKFLAEIPKGYVIFKDLEVVGLGWF